MNQIDYSEEKYKIKIYYIDFIQMHRGNWLEEQFQLMKMNKMK